MTAPSNAPAGAAPQRHDQAARHNDAAGTSAALTVDIPRSWTPEEALAVFELVDDLRNKTRALYSDQLQALLGEQCTDPRADDRDDAIDPLSF